MEDIKRVVVDQDTGEILEELKKGDKILRKESYKFLRSNIRVNYENFFVVNQENLIKMCDYLAPIDFAYFFKLLSYLPYNGMPLGSGRKAIPYSDIAKDLGVHKTTLYRSLKSLEEKGLLRRKGEEIYINPYIAVKGSRVNKEVLDMFDDDIWRDDFPSLL